MTATPAPWRDRADTQTRQGDAARPALIALALLTAFRLVYAAWYGMVQDEMYYWTWSRHLALSYYDQGPGIAWCIRTGTTLLGQTPLGIRLVTVLMGGATGWLTFLTVRRWAGGTLALWSLGLMTVAPLFAVGTILATYDGPQVFFWAAALYALTRTLWDDRPGGWYGVGALVGLGLLCKLTMLLFAPGVLVLLALSPRFRRHLATPHPWLAFAVALALFAPVVVWNAQHGWMGFLHSVALGSRARHAAPFHWFGDFLGGQAIAVSPILFLAELYAGARLFWWGARQKTLDTPPTQWGLTPDAARFFAAFVAPTMALCLVVSLRSKMEVNWPAPAHLTGLVCVAAWLATRWRTRGRAARAGVCVAVGLSALITLLAFFPQILFLTGKPIDASTGQKLNESYGWPEIAARVDAARADLSREGKPVFVGGVSYRVNAALAFALSDKPQPQGLYFHSRRDQFFVWTDPQMLVGQNAVVCLDNQDEEPLRLVRQHFGAVQALPPVVVRRAGFGGAVKTWYLYACRDFRGYDPNKEVDGY